MGLAPAPASRYRAVLYGTGGFVSSSRGLDPSLALVRLRLITPTLTAVYEGLSRRGGARRCGRAGMAEVGLAPVDRAARSGLARDFDGERRSAGRAVRRGNGAAVRFDDRPRDR